MDWEEEMDEREKFFGKVCDQFFDIKEVFGNKLVDDEVGVIMYDGGGLVVGMVLFEMQLFYFQFLDIFFMIIVFKIVMIYYSKVIYFVLLLFFYNKQFLVLDIKLFLMLQQKIYNDILVRFIKGFFSFFRS